MSKLQLTDLELLNADRTALESHQLNRLKMMLAEILPGNQFWQTKLSKEGVGLETINALSDLRQFPFTTKQELMEDQLNQGPYGTNLTYAVDDYCRLHQTSGTTGRPMRWLDTPESWNWLMSCWQQIFKLIGLEKSDRLAFPFSFGPFLGFWAAFEGANRLGNLCLSGGGMSSEARLKLMADHQATMICCTPTYGMRLAEVAEETGINLHDLPVRALIVAGEPGGNIPAIRERLEQAWDARVFDHWGMTEIGALAVEEQETHDTLTILETECIAEIINPENGEAVTPGESGELVLTNLGRWGSPLIRYRTGDIVVQDLSPHPAGRSLLRLKQGIQGRTDDMITIRGNNFYPSAVDAILRELAEVVEYRMILRTIKAMSQLHVEVELTPGADTNDDFVNQLKLKFRERLNFQPEVIVVPEYSLPRFELKGRRFIREEG